MDYSSLYIKEKPVVAIIGGGNVATHLANALSEKADVTLVNPRTLENLPSHSDFDIISVKDTAIREVAQRLKGRDAILAHTSGSIPMSALSDVAVSFGVFYPLQTFTKGVEIQYSEIPFFIEGNDSTTELKLKGLAHLISDNIISADSADRKRLHIASVFACNFTNRLMGIAKEILSESGIDFRVMLPLLRQTISKLDNMTPEEAQTGPAVRNDFGVMDAHIKMLEGDQELQQLYRIFSNQIIKHSES